MGRVQFKGGTLLAPVPPALVTVGNMETANVLTVAWTGIICSDPAMTYVSIRLSSIFPPLPRQKRWTTAAFLQVLR